MLSSLLPDHQSCNKLEVTLTDVFPLLQFHFLSSSVVIEPLLQNHCSHEKKSTLVQCLQITKNVSFFKDILCKFVGVIFKHYYGLVRQNKSRNIMTLCHHLFF